ncbi:MAG: homogentisate 1,2-dioxygenase [Cyanobacteria bacterium HKST-UBA04]|nr:homogentisate 1,2-dioxygenase [Cyanobacteria bacterium HKST-UBA04]
MVLHAKGRYAKRAHFDIPEGLWEEEHGREGFFGPVSHLYRHHPPTGWTDIEGPMRPQAFNAHKLPKTQQLGALPERVVMLYNDEVSMAVWRPASPPDHLFRNADGDELYFVHEGCGKLFTDFGPLNYCPGDYIVIPRGTTYQFAPTTPGNFFLIFEGKGLFREPDRGLLGQHALYDPTTIETPEPEPILETGTFQVKVKRLNQVTTITYPFHPLDVAGWKGDLTVWKISIHDICPVNCHRMHLPPSVHTTFVNDGFIICSFVPRPLETEPGAVKVPFFHRNIDYDEVLFYHDGDFFSRDGIGRGMVTFHPQGIHHGPHPKAIETTESKTDTNEVAVMMDTRQPLFVTQEAQQCGLADYWKSWQ